MKLLILLVVLVGALQAAEPSNSFRVVTFNLENYHLRPFGNRDTKSPEARRQVVVELAALKPDVLAVQEIGERAALEELQTRLREAGVALPYLEHVGGWDTNIFVGVLSRFPFTARRPHTRDSFLLNGRRFFANRGTAELDVEVSPRYHFTLLTTHLKSKRPSAGADEAEIREAEAHLLREKVEALLKRDRNANVIVCGDFNDTKDSPPLRALLGRGRDGLVDTRPAERNGDTIPTDNPRWEPRRITWTHYYGKEDTYSRFDYILLSHGMAREWKPEGSYVFAGPNWGLASDHRPVLCEFSTTEN